MAALPLQIFNYAISPYDEWHRQGGRELGADCPHRLAQLRQCVCRASRQLWSRIVYGRWHTGRKLERVVRQDAGVVRRPIDGGRQSRHGADWALGLRQVDVHTLPEPHARDYSGRAGYGQCAHRRHRCLRRYVGHSTAAAGGDGFSKGQSVSDHVDLRQRGLGIEVERF